jgi:peroxiredoxin
MMSKTLADQTRETVEAFIGGLSEDVQQTVGEVFQRLLSSNITDHAKDVGDTAPEFSLPNVKGGTTSLSELLQRGPVVLSFYRGGWCPFCNLEFKALHDKLPEMQALGATLVGVSPETLAVSRQTVQDHHLEFEVLSDEGNRVARDYGLVMVVDEAIRPYYTQWGIDIPAANGDETFELPVPATYVIDQSGIIRAAHVDKDYTKRMEPTDIVAVLKAL